MNWDKQGDEAIFPDVVWSRPENPNGAGKLLMIGGQAGNMANLAKAYALAEVAGVGALHLLVPDSLAKVTKQIPNINYAPSNRSGGFAKNALAELLATSSGMDGVLLAGDMGKNSETSLTLETFIDKYSGLLGIGSEAFSSLASGYPALVDRPNTILFLSQSQLRELGMALKLAEAITTDSVNSKLAKILHEVTTNHPATIVAFWNDKIWIAKSGRVAECKNVVYNQPKALIWALQQPTKTYEALVSSCL